MGRQTGATAYFLDTVATRENQLFGLLFEAEFVACETQMSQMLAPSR
jgi:hypothetical protein